LIKFSAHASAGDIPSIPPHTVSIPLLSHRVSPAGIPTPGDTGHLVVLCQRKIFGAVFWQRIRVCFASNAIPNVRAPNRHLRRSNRARTVCQAVGAWDTRRTARRCDRRAFRGYSSRENSTRWQADEGGDDITRSAPEVSPVLRGRKQLAQQTIVGYRSDLVQFVESLRDGLAWRDRMR